METVINAWRGHSRHQAETPVGNNEMTVASSLNRRDCHHVCIGYPPLAMRRVIR